MTRKHLKLFFMSLILLLLALVYGCQPTPDKPAVVGKNNQNTQQQATEEPYEAPQHWKEDAPITLNTLTVTIDADISMPDVTKYPVVHVKDKRFTQEEADKIVAELSQGKKLYPNKNTREELERSLISCKAELERLKRESPDSPVIPLDEGMISAYEKEIQALPEKETEEPAVTALHKIEYVNEAGDFSWEAEQVRVDLGKPERAVIDISNGFLAYPSSSHMQFVNGSAYTAYSPKKHEVPPENTAPKGVATTKEQATAMAQDMIEKFGITDMRLAVVRPSYLIVPYGSNDVSEDVQAWQLIYTRQVGGVPLSFYKDNMASYLGGGSAYGAYNSDFTNESVVVQVDDTGVVYFGWWGPMELLDTINGNAKLLPFADIQQRIKEQVPKAYVYSKMGTKTTEVHVTDIELGLTRVRIKDTANDFMLIPTWTVYGYNDETSWMYSGKAKTNPQNFIETLLTLNAMDGSVIDRHLGY